MDRPLAGGGPRHAVPESATWYVGANIDGKPQVFLPYLGGLGPYWEKCDEVAANGYQGLGIQLTRIETTIQFS